MKRIIIVLLFTLFVHAPRGEDVVPSGNGLPTISHSSGKIAKGTDWETDYFIVDSGVRGATVLIEPPPARSLSRPVAVRSRPTSKAIPCQSRPLSPPYPHSPRPAGPLRRLDEKANYFQ